MVGIYFRRWEDALMEVNLIETGTKVEVNGEEFPLYKGETFEESRKIDDLLDSGDYEIYKLSEHENQIERQVEQESFMITTILKLTKWWIGIMYKTISRKLIER